MMFDYHFWALLVTIVWLDLLLSGDNAVVIAAVCRDLPPARRRVGMVLGAGLAVLLRVAGSFALGWLLHLPGLKIAGALALVWVAWGMVPLGDDDEAEERSGAASVWRAVLLVGLADISMSVDNIVALAALAHGNLLLMSLGVLISIPFVILGAALVSLVVGRVPLLLWAGAALLGWIAGGLLVDDPVLAGRVVELWPYPQVLGALLVLLLGLTSSLRRDRENVLL